MRFKISSTVTAMLLILLANNCTGNSYNNRAGINSAFLTGWHEDCQKEIEEMIKKMSGSKNVRLSDKIFQDNAVLLLSNFKPNETPHSDDKYFSETKRFLLHKQGTTCFISMVDNDMLILRSRRLSSCQCADITAED
ncbi:MAG: hypothetical protein GY795_19765 [Desulfobacterales bacterium]|nr:hypothetical protein [Desulfobacterales bacterium]